MYIRSQSTNIASDIILKFTTDIAAGMNMVNEFGIVHRDLKTLIFLFSFFFFLFFSFFLFFETKFQFLSKNNQLIQIKYIIGKR